MKLYVSVALYPHAGLTLQRLMVKAQVFSRFRPRT